MRVDSHMHTPFCGHAIGEPIEYAMVAAEKGIDVITMTCHIPMEWEAFGQAGIRMQREELDDYVALVHETAREAAPLGVEVLCGIEAEVFPDEAELERARCHRRERRDLAGGARGPAARRRCGR